jgi:hypothetical protein
MAAVSAIALPTAGPLSLKQYIFAAYTGRQPNPLIEIHL